MEEASITIGCPECGRQGRLSLGSVVNIDEVDPLTIEAPEGFRKIQLGWKSEEIHLFCVSCGEPAVIAH